MIDDSLDDLKAFGAPAALTEKKKEETFEVWPENWDAIVMFMRLQTQWVIGGMGTIVGLNYQSAEALFRIYRVKKCRALLEDLQEIERGVLDAKSRAEQERTARNGH